MTIDLDKLNQVHRRVLRQCRTVPDVHRVLGRTVSLALGGFIALGYDRAGIERQIARALDGYEQLYGPIKGAASRPDETPAVRGEVFDVQSALAAREGEADTVGPLSEARSREREE